MIKSTLLSSFKNFIGKTLFLQVLMIVPFKGNYILINVINIKYNQSEYIRILLGQ